MGELGDTKDESIVVRLPKGPRLHPTCAKNRARRGPRDPQANR
jgi:hypothetical protein